MKKKPPFNQNAAIRGAIRRIFSRSPVKQEVLKAVRRESPKYNKNGERSKKDAVEYLCNNCKQYVGSTKVEVDHLQPVIEINELGFVDWNTFVDRLFCKADQLQVLCDPCHDIKTAQERKERQSFKDKVILDKIENQIKAIDSIHHAKDLLKQTKKFTTKTKADATKQRAQELIVKLKDIIERQD